MATNVVKNAVIDLIESAVEPIQTAVNQSSSSAMFFLPPNNLQRMSRASWRRDEHMILTTVQRANVGDDIET